MAPTPTSHRLTPPRERRRFTPAPVRMAKGCPVSDHPIIPTCGHRIFPIPPDRGGRVHERDIVVGTGAGGRRHWPRGHTTRGGTHGPGRLLAAGAPVVPHRAAIEVGDRPAVGAGSEDGPRHPAGGGVAALHAHRAGRYSARRPRRLSAAPGARGSVLGADPVPGVAPRAALPWEL